MRVDIAGRELRLLPERALWCLDSATVFVADPHFGKDAHFRSAGVAVPAGTTHADLQRIERVVESTGARRLVFLGDFLHDVGSRSDETFGALRSWRRRNASLEIVLVAGNHDARAGSPPQELDIEVVNEPHFEAPFAWLHHPREVPDAHALAGHVHPGVRLASSRGRRMSVPIFLVTKRLTILPSFGGFTGLGIVEPRPGDRVFLCGEHAVVEWTSPAR